MIRKLNGVPLGTQEREIENLQCHKRGLIILCWKMAQKRLTSQSALFYCSIVVLHFNKLTTSAHQQNDCNVFLKKWATLASFSFYFRSLETNNTIFTANQYEKCPSSIQCWDSNPEPLKYELSPITTRPGHPPYECNVFTSDDESSIFSGRRFSSLQFWCIFQSIKKALAKSYQSKKNVESTLKSFKLLPTFQDDYLHSCLLTFEQITFICLFTYLILLRTKIVRCSTLCFMFKRHARLI